MAARLGATFLLGAMAPLKDAGTMLASGRVGDALALLTDHHLMPALQAGIAGAAKRADVRPERIDKLMPWEELRSCLEHLETAQRVAHDAWKQHAGGLGGMLSGVGDVTAEGETPDPGWYLSKLAGKLVRDKRLSHPLDALAVAVTGWQQLLGRCGAAVDASGALHFSFRFKRIRLVLICLAATGAVAWLVANQLARQADERRIAEALGNADPCSAGNLSAEVMRRATEEQRSLQKNRLDACEAARARAKLAATCEGLVTHLEAGKLTPEDQAFVGAKTPLFTRIASGSLEAADLRLGDADLECGCSGIAPRIWPLVGKAASRSASAWSSAEAVSERVRGLLTRPGAGLDAASQQVLTERAEPIAKRAVFQGAADDIARGRTLCDLGRSLQVEPGKWCTALGVALARQKP